MERGGGGGMPHTFSQKQTRKRFRQPFFCLFALLATEKLSPHLNPSACWERKWQKKKRCSRCVSTPGADQGTAVGKLHTNAAFQKKSKWRGRQKSSLTGDRRNRRSFLFVSFCAKVAKGKVRKKKGGGGQKKRNYESHSERTAFFQAPWT